MKKSAFVSLGLATALLLSGCGLADVGASAAAEGTSAAEQVKEGKKLEDKVQRDIEAAQKAETDARAKAEAANQ
jgi:major membrane immunogen (membrane-anchored lipoprotein)